MKFSRILPAVFATVVAACAGHDHDHAHDHKGHGHDHAHEHKGDGLGAVCGSSGLPPGADGGCQPDAGILPGGHKEVFADAPTPTPTPTPTPDPKQKPVANKPRWSKCPEGETCEPVTASQHEWQHSAPCITSEKSGTEFCSFTDTKFANGRGISVVMPAHRANYIATSPAFSEPDLIKDINQDLIVTIPHKYEMREIPGKGMGLIATDFIRRGDLIMANTASLMIDYRAFEELDREQYQHLQAYAVDYLPKDHRERVLALSTHDNEDLSHNAKIDKIFATNAFDIDPDDDDAEQHYGFYVLFPEIARMNHDCRPNGDYFFDHTTLSQYIHATRDIQPGQEITLSYISPLMTREARQKKLKRIWGFGCICPHCSQAKASSDASDLRIRQVQELFEEFKQKGPSSRASPQMAELYISLHEQEGMYGIIYEAYMYAALEYNGVGEAWLATKYARLAVQHGIYTIGERDPDVREMMALAEDPWAHWSWQIRLKKRGGWGRRTKIEDDE